MRGFAKVEMPSCMILGDVTALTGERGPWASPPSTAMIGRDGVLTKDAAGNARYSPVSTWRLRKSATASPHASSRRCASRTPRRCNDLGIRPRRRDGCASTRADVAVGAAPVAVSPLLEIVRFRKADDEPLTRRVYLGANGGPVGDGSACRMWTNFSGSARRGSAIMRRSTANPSGVKKRQGSRIPGAASEFRGATRYGVGDAAGGGPVSAGGGFVGWVGVRASISRSTFCSPRSARTLIVQVPMM